MHLVAEQEIMVSCHISHFLESLCYGILGWCSKMKYDLAMDDGVCPLISFWGREICMPRVLHETWCFHWRMFIWKVVRSDDKQIYTLMSSLWCISVASILNLSAFLWKQKYLAEILSILQLIWLSLLIISPMTKLDCYLASVKFNWSRFG